nr:5'-methylthioadenosine/S-adenosylhomocysteine nucleosidase [Arcanobacterium phocae]
MGSKPLPSGGPVSCSGYACASRYLGRGYFVKQIDALVISAMDEEMAPFLSLIQSCNPKLLPSPVGTAYQASKGQMRMILMVTKVGMTACASALGWLLANYKPKVIVSIGSAGGLARNSRVGQVIVGREYLNGGADGQAFGYTRGQVPGQPSSFLGDARMISALEQYAATGNDDSPIIRIGQMLSSDAFVTEANVATARDDFPEALSADMESHAAAQVAHAWGIPFVSIRGISDLCGDPDDQAVSFHAELSDVATAAAKVACYALQHSDYISIERCVTQRFSQPTLTSALYVMLARRYDLPAGDRSVLDPAGMKSVRYSIGAYGSAIMELLIDQIAAGKAFALENPDSVLTAKDYDRLRAEFIASIPDDVQTDTFAWPPTSQTIIKRFDGYWNEALKAIGLVTRQGRVRGGIKYSSEDYQSAMNKYIAYARSNGFTPSFAGYSDFAKTGMNKSKVPSGAAIRQHFGSWSKALNSVA